MRGELRMLASHAINESDCESMIALAQAALIAVQVIGEVIGRLHDAGTAEDEWPT